MEDKLKSTQCLILERIKGRDKWVFICFVISILIIIGYEFMTAACILNFIAACIQNFMEAVIFILSKGKNLLYTLAVSYVSGVFVYYLTIIVPEVRRSKPILVEVEKTLKYLIDYIHEEVNFINSDDAVRVAMHYLERQKLEDRTYILKCCNPILRKVHPLLDALTSHILSHSSALTQSELDTLIDIRHRRITYRIRYKYDMKERLYQEQVKDEIKEFVQLNKDIIEFHKKIKSRIYK